MRNCRPAPARDGRASRMGTRHVADARARSAGRVDRMRVAPEPPRSVAHARRAAQARRNEAAQMHRGAPAQPIPRMPRRHAAARRSPPSGPRRPPVQHRPRLRAPRSRLPQSGISLPPRRQSVRPARLPRSVNGSANVPVSNRLPPERRPARRLRRLSRLHLRPRPSSGRPRAHPVRPMRSGQPGQVTPSDRTASVLATSVLAGTHLPRPQPRRLPRRPLPQRPLQHPLLRRLHLLRQQRGPSRPRQPLPLLLRQREPSRRHPHRARPHLSRQRLPRPSRWILPASASKTCAASGGSVVRAAV